MDTVYALKDEVQELRQVCLPVFSFNHFFFKWEKKGNTVLNMKLVVD